MTQMRGQDGRAIEPRAEREGWFQGVSAEPVHRLEGSAVSVGTRPEEIAVLVGGHAPAVLRVRPGDHVYESDAAHLERLGPSAPRLADWEVLDIDPDAVRVRNRRTAARETWPRHVLERGLAVGTFATDLTDFETVTVTRSAWPRGARGQPAGMPRPPVVGPGGEYHAAPGVPAAVVPVGPTVTVAATGDNGRTYRRHYRLTDPDTGEVERWPVAERWPTESAAVVRRLESRIGEALAAEGYEEVVAEE